MIGFVTIGTNDLARAGRFYDGVLLPLGAKRWMESDCFIAWAHAGEGRATFAVTLPWDGKPATVGNGGMVAWKVDSKALVDTVDARALELGARRSRGPGGDGVHAAFFRDPDGNKVGVYCEVTPA